MTREIKFRAWDNESEMISWEEIKRWFVGVTFDTSVQNFPVMQFTGLKDKNGVEIYEGDILKSTFRYSMWSLCNECGKKKMEDKVDNLEIVFYEGAFINSWQRKVRENGSITTGQYDSFEQSEVIGNIYENPELLTSK